MIKELIERIRGDKQDRAFYTLKGALDGSSAAVMMIDRDFIVTYVNEASKKLFIEAIDDFHEAFPSFDPNNIIGTCIDVFHKHPEHQRKMLADTSRLPFQTDIKVGSLTITLHVTASFDGKGRHIGNVLEWRNVTVERAREKQNTDFAGQIAAIGRFQAAIQFTPDGRIIEANDNFLNVVGYEREEILGQHHSLFVDPAYKSTNEYRSFWEKLGRGEYDAGQYKRITKDGREVWLQASYNPILDAQGKVVKIVKFASDITEEKHHALDISSQMAAIERAEGIIELAMDGTIIRVNQNYLQMLGYSESEMLGKNISAFADPNQVGSSGSNSLWDKLHRGEAVTGDYKRIGKGGREIWIHGSYNPIPDLNGKLHKVVAYVDDITEEKLKNADFEGQMAAISKIEGIIEFSLDGKVTKVNENFARVTGYTQEEIVGKNHSMFIDAAYKGSQEYKDFWSKLGRGEADAGQYKRIGKGGKEIWLQASYNPIFDLNGKAFKVVKYATDVTDVVRAQQALVMAVAETQDVVAAAKAGDLTQRISTSDKTGEIANLCGGVNDLIESMAEIITQIKEASDTINTAAGEISAGNNDLSQRTEEQASSLEETASSMEELASTVKQNAENAKQANQLAASASGVAVKGGSVVGEVVKTMSDISESSRKIEDIISVIDGIAFQTNILALNAAVEAARAGEQGRGFAVVAAEVRNLAQRSAGAAKEIKQLISDSVDKVQSGTKLVEEAGTTMDDIVSSVKRVTDIMGEIAAASVEQSSGIDQVNSAVTQMDEVTQQNAALVEQAAAAAESLVEQANSLMDAVSVFKVRADGTSERRNSVSNMRSASSAGTPSQAKTQKKQTASAKPSKVTTLKTGTDAGDWEEF